MCDLPVFDPRNSAYKFPFGAVKCGQTLRLTLRPPLAEDFVRCLLVLYHDFSGRREELELTRCSSQEDRAVFSLSFSAPREPDLIWYHFLFYRSDGTCRLLDRSGWQAADHQPVSWQLTVYDASHPTPAWFGEGITYQIFPDRFCRLSIPDPRGMVGDRVVHQDWGEAPEWRPDEHGEVRNRDFFGGSLAGITSRLDYLQSLSVTTLYLCPIFLSASNHRYNTADYLQIDPMLGTEEDFRTLCREAEKRGMRVILDGVFNHTGSDSVYFNAAGSFSALGAAQSQDSPYYSWYHFSHWPDQYDAWWGITTLPAVNESDPGYGDFIIDSPDSVIRRWLRCGASGWRLDVADELPDEFIARIRTACEETKADSILIGEVWEDGSNKIAYSRRRKYLLGHETHGLMNYPFRNAVLAFLRGGDAADFRESMETIRENYPPAAFYSLMNFLGTHDTGRILTVLGAETVPEDKDSRSEYRLSDTERQRGTALLRLAALLLYTFPGSPTIFYGDEAGMEGFEDPFNRGTFPWGREDRTLTEWYRLLGCIRQERPSLLRGHIEYLRAQGHCLIWARQEAGERTVTAVNAGDQPMALELPWEGAVAEDLLTGQRFLNQEGKVSLVLPPLDGVLLS